MDNKKLAKLINEIVKLRLEKILKSDEFKKLIREQAEKEIISVLLEAKGITVNVPSNKNNSTKLSTLEILGENNKTKERTYPKLPNKKFSNNESINRILTQTAVSPEMNSFNSANNMAELVDSGKSFGKASGVSINPGSLADEALILAQSDLARNGIVPAEIKMNNESISTFKDNFDDQYIDYKEDITSNVQNSNNVNLENVFNRDYSALLEAADKKAKEKRPKI